MDDKTLEYMGERVDKARDLKTKIAHIDSKLNVLTIHGIRTVGIVVPHYTGILSMDSWLEVKLTKKLGPEFIKTLDDIKEELQQELDEI